LARPIAITLGPHADLDLGSTDSRLRGVCRTPSPMPWRIPSRDRIHQSVTISFRSEGHPVFRQFSQDQFSLCSCKDERIRREAALRRLSAHRGVMHAGRINARSPSAVPGLDSPTTTH
jgi:hypothetical protein